MTWRAEGLTGILSNQRRASLRVCWETGELAELAVASDRVYKRQPYHIQDDVGCEAKVQLKSA